MTDTHRNPRIRRLWDDGRYAWSRRNPVSRRIPIGAYIDGGTVGSILFIGGGTALAQNNTQLYWNDSDAKLTVNEADIYTPGASGGTRNLVVGNNSGNLTMTGSNNTVIGPQTAQALTSSVDGVFIGLQTGQLNQDGIDNTFVGSYAGAFNVSGSECSFFGWRAGYKNTANANTFLGSHAGYENTTGQDMCGVGYRALEASVTAVGGTAIGFQALYQSTGDENTGIGVSAGGTIVSGSRNTFIGANADGTTTSGQYRIAIGYNASAIADSTCFIGGASGSGYQVKLVVGGDAIRCRNDAGAITSGAADDVSWARAAANVWQLPGTGGRSLYVGDGVFTGYSGVTFDTVGGTPTDYFLLGRTSAGDRYVNAPSGGSLNLQLAGTTNILINSSGIKTSNVGHGFYGTSPISKQTGVAVTATGIHNALVNLGLFSA